MSEILNELQLSPIEEKVYLLLLSAGQLSVHEIAKQVEGSPEEVENAVKLIQEEIGVIKIETDKEGIILKADTLGALEALVKEFRDRKVPIKIADIGDVSKANVTDAIIVKENNPSLAAIVTFNVGILPDAQEELEVNDIAYFHSDIIYTLLDEYERWKIELERVKQIYEANKVQYEKMGFSEYDNIMEEMKAFRLEMQVNFASLEHELSSVIDEIPG